MKETWKSILSPEKLAFVFLSATLFSLSLPRQVSLYTIAMTYFTGLAAWILDYRGTMRFIRHNILLFSVQLLYFGIQTTSLLIQGGNISEMESRTLFLLIPLFVMPLFKSEYLYARIPVLIRFFITGIILVSVFLLLRIIVIILSGSVGDGRIISILSANDPELVSSSFSIFEHPSYLSMKIIFCFVLIAFGGRFAFRREIWLWGLFILFSLTLFFLASKAGLILWWITGVAFIAVKTIRGRGIARIVPFIAAVWFVLLTIYSLKEIDRFSYFLVYTGRGLEQEQFDWKNLDQRTREWYTATRIIRQKPLFGAGISRIGDTLEEEYLKEGWIEEAELRMNAHNQFLEAQMTYGIAGSVSLVLLVFFPLIFRRKVTETRNALLFIGITTFFMLFESMLNRQWGIMFFLLLANLLWLSPEKIKQEIKQNQSDPVSAL